MTRDEATNKFYEALIETQVNSYRWCGGIVDGLIAAGVLQVDSSPGNPLEALALSMSLAQSSGPLTAAKVAGHLGIMGFAVVKK